jgi:alpha-ketoglutarate-dependent taurine dioxygenase
MQQHANFGKVYEGLWLQAIMDNADSIYQDLLNHKVLVFKNINSEPDQVANCLKSLSKNHNYLKIDTYQTSKQLFDYFKENNKTLPSSSEYFSRWGVDRWHVDDSWEELVVDISCMHMRKPSAIGGFTKFVDLERSYDKLTDSQIDFISKMKSPGWNANINEPPMYRKSEFMHPSVVAHPETKKLSVFYNGQNTVAKDNDKWVEYKLALLEIFEIQENQMCITWDKNDLVIWDNRCVAHSLTGGFERDERIYDKYEIGKSRVVAASL